MSRFDDIDKFANELMDEFLRLCNYNDYGKINLLTISETIDTIYGKCINEMLDEMDNAPTADVVEVVRCKDCVYRTGYINQNGFEVCPISGMDITDDDFCSLGERKEQP